MKQYQINQKVQEIISRKKQSIGKAGTDLSKNIRKSDDESFEDTPEEPDTPETPATPNTPRREYEDPGHEHIYQPPTDFPASSGSIKGFLGK